MVALIECHSPKPFVLLVLFGVLLSVLGPLCLPSPIWAWGFLVLGSLSTTLWLKPRLPPDSLALYFVVSVLGSLLFCISSSNTAPLRLLCCLGLLLLLGFSPFQFWVFKVLVHLDLFSLFLFLGPIKIRYLYLLLLSLRSFWVLGLLPFVVGSLVLFSSGLLCLILYSSSSLQVILLFFMDPTFFVLFFSIYF